MLDDNIIKNAAEQFGTPLYLYDGDQISETYGGLKSKLPAAIDIFYSMKANPLLGINQLLHWQGACCEVCSAAELLVALKAGFSPHNIIFVGPGKSTEELVLCIKNKIYAIVCESLEELNQLNELAEKYNIRCSILIRVNPDFAVDNAPLKMGGKPTQFGIDLAWLKQHPIKASDYSWLNILGIHVYNATRILHAQAVINNVERILVLADELANAWSLTFSCVDFGGGFGIPYFADESSLDIQFVAEGIFAPVERYLKKYPQTRLILESGRYLVGISGMLVARVLTVKSSHKENFVITDAGLNCHMAATGIGSFVRRNFPIHLIKQNTVRNDEQEYNITGPLCTPGDVMAKKIKMLAVEPGDFIVIKNSGAYGSSASPGRFLSHGFPAEVLIHNKKFSLLKRRETVDDILSTQFALTPLNNLNYHEELHYA
jgi:diaminopimelate decarboxylase